MKIVMSLVSAHRLSWKRYTRAIRSDRHTRNLFDGCAERGRIDRAHRVRRPSRICDS